ncbi:MAG: glucose 1-dehydrogenase [Bryobacteraceae bacterium]|nr:glucose 1-dehydrogenase [Bryobacteraceae bacterium]
MSSTRLLGKRALITGASSGIGRAIAIRFAREGASVAINYRSQPEEAEITRQQAVAAAQEAGHPDVKAVVIGADVADEAQIMKMFATTLSSLGGIDILINNAGIQKAAESDQIDIADFDRVLNVNLRGTFLCAREALKHFLANGIKGVIVNNSSVHEIIPKPLYLPYSISKGGMENLTRTLGLEYAGRGIRVNAVGPGAIVTPINNAWINDPVKSAEVCSHIPMGRAGEADEIAGVFAFLASSEASYITGQTLFACGGLTLFPEFRTGWSS